MQQGGTSSAILNAANEIAVSEFLQKRIRFTDIARVIEAAVENVEQHSADSIEIILEDDQCAREFALNMIRDMAE